MHTEIQWAFAQKFDASNNQKLQALAALHEPRQRNGVLESMLGNCSLILGSDPGTKKNNKNKFKYASTLL